MITYNFTAPNMPFSHMIHGFLLKVAIATLRHNPCTMSKNDQILPSKITGGYI